MSSEIPANTSAPSDVPQKTVSANKILLFSNAVLSNTSLFMMISAAHDQPMKRPMKLQQLLIVQLISLLKENFIIQ